MGDTRHIRAGVGEIDRGDVRQGGHVCTPPPRYRTRCPTRRMLSPPAWHVNGSGRTPSSGGRSGWGVLVFGDDRHRLGGIVRVENAPYPLVLARRIAGHRGHDDLLVDRRGEDSLKATGHARPDHAESGVPAPALEAAAGLLGG